LFIQGFYKELRYVVNWDPAITELIAEVKYMEVLGMPIPDAVKSTVLLERKYINDVFELKEMVKRYHFILSGLNEAEAELLNNYILGLHRTIMPAARRMNWENLCILEYVGRVSIIIIIINQVLIRRSNVASHHTAPYIKLQYHLPLFVRR